MRTIEPGDAPNVYVSVLVLRGAGASTHRAKMPEYRVGYAALTVKRRDAELNVYARPAQPKYEPGQEVEVKFPSLHDRTLPVLKGTLTKLSADSFADENRLGSTV